MVLSVEFGPQGALILAVDIADFVTRTTASSWMHRDLSAAQRVLLKWVLAEGAASNEDVGDCIQDLVADIESESLRGSPPNWLTLARERLLEDPASARIDELACTAGVHRAHFARSFQHGFKSSPSLFRRRAMLTRALPRSLRANDSERQRMPAALLTRVISAERCAV